ncbi:uncharacterized protein LOC107040517 [Diachasma alloeum]|uniref:uncharacterized protein LOC107040517 n=1 Tax=Diachasma alloeum TaxID=454923 RepID=UPI0007383455|nr:uncharacterized protein LOC107040517 [Diachasma alloeum]
MHDGLLKLTLPNDARLVAFADDVAVVIVAKHLAEIHLTFHLIFEEIRRWMDAVGLTLAEHKTEAVLITSRKKVVTITLKVGDYELTFQPFIWYLGVMIDPRLNFKHVEHVAIKASWVRTLLSRLISNIEGSQQKRRALLSTVVTSVLNYGIPIWADALQFQKSRRKIAPVYRQSVLRVASAYRIVSEDAVCVIAGMLSIEVLAEKRTRLYQRRRHTTLSPKDLREEERRNSTSRWQVLWDTSAKGRWTQRLIPQLDIWLNRPHGEVNYYLTQMLSGHGCFRKYLHNFKLEEIPECPTCSGEGEDAEHVFFRCKRFAWLRSSWETTVKQRVPLEDLVKVMISSKAAWDATSTFAAEVLEELRREEQARRK